MNRQLKRRSQAICAAPPPPITLSDLPPEILAHILARAASKAATDYAALVMACKAAWAASRGFNVLSEASLAEVGLLPWRKEKLDFIKRCASHGHPEALFRHALITFFSPPTAAGYFLDSCLNLLRQSFERGLMKSGYLLGLISVYCRGPTHFHEGLETLSALAVQQTSNPRRLIWHYRRDCAKMVSQFWGMIPYWEPPTDPNCPKCKRLDVHDITRGNLVEDPFSHLNNWYLLSSWNDWEVEPDNWRFVVDMPDPLYGIRCSTCFWVEEAKLFFNYIAIKSNLQLKKLDL